jgi:alanyl-tRNA synthetase
MQQGSLVDEDRLRFDFTHPKALSSQELERIEDLLNTFIANNDAVTARNISLKEAKEEGALAFFKDKYKEEVRVVSIGSYSKELCGGTHLDNTAEIASFVIVSEASISSGIRRIEALVGFKAYDYLKNIRRINRESAAVLKCKPEDLTSALRRLFDEIKEEREKVILLEKKDVSAKSKEIIAAKKEIGGVNFLTHIFDKNNPETLLYLCDLLKSKLTTFFAFFISRFDKKDVFVCYASDGVIKKGLSADTFVNRFKDKLGLHGGGRKNLVQGIIQPGFRPDYRDQLNECFKEFVSK